MKQLARDYPDGTKIAHLESNGYLAGSRLRGQMILEVPVQQSPIPQQVLDAAREAKVIIRDVNGKVY